MEYEICGEERLFDESTNPSLELAPLPASRSAFPRGRRNSGGVTVLDRNAEVIVEEEHQLA